MINIYIGIFSIAGADYLVRCGADHLNAHTASGTHSIEFRIHSTHMVSIRHRLNVLVTASR